MAKYHKLKTQIEVEDDPSLPYDIYRPENIAIVMAYFSIGLTGSFLSTPLNVYLVEHLNAEPQMQNTIGILQTLPWSMKLVFGFLSDACPIGGMHRKPYLIIGALMYSLSFMVYSFTGIHNVSYLATSIFLGTVGLIVMDVMVDTMCVQRSKFEPEESKGQMQASCYSIRFAGSLLGAIMGATLCNKDSWGWGLSYFEVSFLNGVIPFFLVIPFLFTLREKYHVKKVKNASIQEEDGGVELGLKKVPTSNSSSVTPHHRNTKQDKKLVVDEHSLLIHDSHAVGGGYHSVPHIDIVDNSLYVSPTPSEKQPHTPNPKHIGNSQPKSSEKGDNNIDDAEEIDDDEEKTQSISNQIEEIWETVQLQAVWRPMCFVYIFNMFQVPNVAWQSYLQLCLEFPPWILGATVILGSFMTFAGVLGYKYFFFKSSWRSIYVWTVMLTAFFSMMQLVLIFQLNQKYLHMSNYIFSMGDDVISAYISGIQFLPLCIMYMRLCPEGAEGASYAMLTTFGNIALVCASNIGNMISNIWDVSNDAMREKNVDGLWKLNTLTSCLAVLPLVLLFLLPKDAEEQDQLAKSKAKSKLAGGIFLAVLFGSLMWTTITAVVRIRG